MKKTFGQQTIGGRGGSGSTIVSPSNLYVVVGGQSLPYIGQQGILKVTTTIESISVVVSGNGMPSTLPDGIGWIRSLDDNSLKLTVNDSTSLYNHDLLANQAVYGIQTAVVEDISGNAFPIITVAGVI